MYVESSHGQYRPYIKVFQIHNTVDQKLKSDKFQNMSMGPDILANLLLTMPFSSKLEQQLQVYIEKKSLSYLNFILPVVLYQEIWSLYSTSWWRMQQCSWPFPIFLVDRQITFPKMTFFMGLKGARTYLKMWVWQSYYS